MMGITIAFIFVTVVMILLLCALMLTMLLDTLGVKCKSFWVICTDPPYSWFEKNKLYRASIDFFWLLSKEDEKWYDVRVNRDGRWERNPFKPPEFNNCFRKACKLEIALKKE